MEDKHAITSYLAQDKSLDGIEIIKINSPVMVDTDKIIILNLSTNTISFRFQGSNNKYGCTEKTLVSFLQEVVKLQEREVHNSKNLEILEKLDELQELFAEETTNQLD